ncbi:hypothetical protein B0H11DRAFT_2158457 [Mycena galericulata]|nr:hypothetical protein B0H11DRAFT_2158457 [Mycena galericulata]
MQLTENFRCVKSSPQRQILMIDCRLNRDLAEFVSTIYTTAFESQNVQDKQLATKLRSIQLDIRSDQRAQGQVLWEARRFLLALSDVMMHRPQTILTRPPITLDPKANLAPPSFSLALVRLETKSKQVENVGFEAHVRAEAALAAALVLSIKRCSPGEDIFVATPRRIQRHAVNAALILAIKSKTFELHEPAERLAGGTVTVDTIERLQGESHCLGSEAAFVICLFSLPPSLDPSFLLERRRLNVAISRAKTLCILITSSTILRPSIHVLANKDSEKGYAFLRAFEDRAWSSTISLDVDDI